MASLSMGSCLIIGLMLCSGMLCQTDNCNYWYDQVPKSSNETNCSTRMGDSITLVCAVYHPCDGISIDWYRSVAEEDDNNMNREERLCNGPHTADGKYQCIQAHDNASSTDTTFVNYCFTSLVLTIHYQFILDGMGYYWCQIVTPNGTLQNSPYAFISLHCETVADVRTCRANDYIHHLNPPICATDRNYFSTSETRTCTATNSPTETPTTMSSISRFTTHETTGLTSESTTHSTITVMPTTSTPATYASTSVVTSDSSDHETTGENTTEVSTSPTSTDRNSTTAMPTSNDLNMLWVYMIMAGIVTALVLLFVVCFIILYCRYRALQKRAYLNAASDSDGRAGPRVTLHQNISYNKVTLKESNKLRSTAIPTVPNSQLEREMSLDISHGENSHNNTHRSRNLIDFPQVNLGPPKYTNYQNAQQPTAGETVDYAVPIIGDRRKPMPDVTAEKGLEMSTHEAPSYPPPVYSYARVPKISPVVVAQAAGSTSPMSVHKQNPTPEYAEVRDGTRLEDRHKLRQGVTAGISTLEGPSHPPPVYSYARVPNKLQAVRAHAAGNTPQASSNVLKRSPTPEYAAVTMGFTDKEMKEAEHNYYHSLENPNECNIVETDNHYHCLENPNECSTAETNMNENGVFDSDIYTAPYMVDTRSEPVQHNGRMKNVFPLSQQNYATVNDKSYYQESGVDEDHYYHSLENPN